VPIGTPVNIGPVASTVQVLVTKAFAVFLQRSLAEIVKIWVTAQELVVHATVTENVAWLQESFKVTALDTLVTVGKVPTAGLHP